MVCLENCPHQGSRQASHLIPQAEKAFFKMMESNIDVAVTDRRRRSRRDTVTTKARKAKQKELQPQEEVDSLESEDREVNDRRKTDRRRQIDPTTCERDYSGNEVEFMRAMDDYKRRSGRPFPTWSEVLEVFHSLGYRKVAEPSQMEWRSSGD